MAYTLNQLSNLSDRELLLLTVQQTAQNTADYTSLRAEVSSLRREVGEHYDAVDANIQASLSKLDAIYFPKAEGVILKMLMLGVLTTILSTVIVMILGQALGIPQAKAASDGVSLLVKML